MRDLIFILSATLILVGAALYITHWIYSAYVMGAGALAVTFCYMTAPHEDNFRFRRLARMNVFAGILMTVAAVFMYIQRNEWVVLLLIAAILQLYTSLVRRQQD